MSLLTPPGPHALICGPTGCGKSTLATALSRLYYARGFGVLVCDRFRDRRWHAHRVVATAEELVKLGDAAKNCHLFCDEIGVTLRRGSADHKRLTTDMRHRGHYTTLIGQYPTQAEPELRTNITRLILFFCTDGLDLVAKEWGDRRLRWAERLKRGEFLVKDKMGELFPGKILDFSTGKIWIGKPMQ